MSRTLLSVAMVAIAVCSGCGGTQQKHNIGPTYAEAVTIYEAELNELSRVKLLPAFAQESHEADLAEIANELRKGRAIYDARYKNIGVGEDRDEVESWWLDYVDGNDAKKKAAKDSFAARLMEIEAKIAAQQQIVHRAIAMRDKARLDIE